MSKENLIELQLLLNQYVQNKVESSDGVILNDEVFMLPIEKEDRLIAHEFREGVKEVLKRRGIEHIAGDELAELIKFYTDTSSETKETENEVQQEELLS